MTGDQENAGRIRRKEAGCESPFQRVARGLPGRNRHDAYGRSCSGRRSGTPAARGSAGCAAGRPVGAGRPIAAGRTIGVGHRGATEPTEYLTLDLTALSGEQRLQVADMIVVRAGLTWEERSDQHPPGEDGDPWKE